MEHAKATSQTADVTYLDAVKNLEEARNLWEREMELLCNVSIMWSNFYLPMWSTFYCHIIYYAICDGVCIYQQHSLESAYINNIVTHVQFLTLI